MHTELYSGEIDFRTDMQSYLNSPHSLQKKKQPTKNCKVLNLDPAAMLSWVWMRSVWA